MSLRTKLVLTHTLVALLAIIIVAVALNRAVTSSVRRLAVERAAEETQRMAGLISAAYEQRGSWPEVLQILNNPRPAARMRLPGQRMLIADNAGTVLYDTADRLEGRPLPETNQEMAAPVIANGQQVGTLSIAPAIGVLGEVEERFLTNVNRLLVLVSGIAGVCAALLGLALALGLTRPLTALTNATQQISHRRTHQPLALPIVSRDEVGQLTTAFNQMSAELARQEELRQQMVADIAHELRTPISVLRMELEAFEDGIAQPTPDRLISLQEEVDLLGRLVDDLRLISLADHGQLSLQLDVISPTDMVQRLISSTEQRARQNGITLQSSVETTLPNVIADPQRLAQVLGNLLENAIRYTPAGGTVTLCALLNHAKVQFVVRDTGPGIPPSELEQVFERFYRSDRARSRVRGGSGLGLAIVRSLVDAMGGNVWAESPTGQGAQFVVALPVAQPVRAKMAPN